MSASPRRRSLLGRPGGPTPKGPSFPGPGLGKPVVVEPRPGARRAVTAPLRIGPELRAAIAKGDSDAIEALEAEFAELDQDDEPTDRGPPGDVEETLGGDDLDGDEDSEGERTSWVATDGAEVDAKRLALGVLPTERLEVMENGIAGSGHRGDDASDTFELDEPPSEEVRRDPRFHGIDFRDGRPGSNPGLAIEEFLAKSSAPAIPVAASRGGPETDARPQVGAALPDPGPSAPSGALVPILAAVSSGGALLLGGGGLVLVLLVAWVVTSWSAPGVAPATEPVLVTTEPPPIAEPEPEPEGVAPPAEDPVPDGVDAPAPAPVARRRTPPKPVEIVVPEPEPPPPAVPVAAPEPPPPASVEEDDRKGKKKKKK